MLPNALFLNVHMYGIMVAVGLLCCFLVIWLYAKKCGVDQRLIDFTYYDGVGAVLFGFGAAALFQATYEYIRNPAGGFRLGSGITFLGGLIGGAGFFLIIYFALRRKWDLHLLDILPVIPCSITVAHGWGRIGCFFAGCCYGKETDSFLGVTFPGMTHAVHPTQLYEAAFLFLLFGILSYLVLKKRYPYTMSVYLVAYGAFRFLIEFLRGDERGQFIGSLSPSQFWSIVMILIGIGWFFLQRKLQAKRDAERNPAA